MPDRVPPKTPIELLDRRTENLSLRASGSPACIEKLTRFLEEIDPCPPEGMVHVEADSEAMVILNGRP